MEGDSSAGSTDPVTDITNFAHKIGLHLPGWVLTVCAGLVALAALLTLCRPLLPVFKWVGRNVRWLVQRPRGTAARRRRIRRRFAEHLANELRQLALQEEWRDDKYAELEAEVEIEQGQRWLRLPWRSTARRLELERVPSLSRALQRSRDRRILLEGEPGSGKSVALRHVAWQLARWAAAHGDENAVVPIYVNLKDFRMGGAKVTARHVHDFVIDSLNRANSRDVEEFLDEEFVRGMEHGTWLFLFDSFDEIPDILGAVDSGPVVAQYTDAILSFLGPLNDCRGVIASREFHAPRSAGLTRFRIVRLTDKQQRQLVRKADLPGAAERAVLEGLRVAGPELAAFVDNPMFLGLLCEHMRNGNAFPASSHAVFEGYLAQRFIRDANRISRRFGITSEFLRAGAEDIAFAMASVSSLGLSPVVGQLRLAVAGLDRIAPAQFDRLLRALDYIKVGRLDDLRPADLTSFTFAHRRFQEYFATCVVIRDVGRVPARTLLTNGRWRETAVTLLQTCPPAVTETVVGEAAALLRGMASPNGSAGFAWPPGCLHVLGVLAAGLSRRPDGVGAGLRGMVDTLLTAAWDSGRRLDRRRALTFALLASTEVSQRLLEDGFSSGNELLVETAFSQASQIRQPSPAIQRGVRRTLITLSKKGKIFSDRVGTGAQLKRFPERERLLAYLRLIQAVPVAELLLLAVIFAVVSFRLDFIAAIGFYLATAFYRVMGFYLILDLGSWSAPTRVSRFWPFLAAGQRRDGYRDVSRVITALIFSLVVAAPYAIVLYYLIGGPLGVVVGVLVSWYAWLLPIGLVVAVVLDENVQPAAWPLLPFVALRAAWVRAPRAVSWASNHMINLTVWMATSFVSVLAIVASSTAAVIAVILLVLSMISALEGRLGPVTKYVAVVILVVVLGIQTPGFARDLRYRARLRRLVKSLEPFTKADLLRAIELSTAEPLFKGLVQSLRRNASRCAPDVAPALAGIAATVELLNRDRNTSSRYLVDVLPELHPAAPVFGRWQPVMRYLTIPYRTLRVRSVTEATLNEIARFAEEAETAAMFVEPTEPRATSPAEIA
jgi:hypothetical protein